LRNLDVNKDNTDENTGLVLIISLITSSLRSLRVRNIPSRNQKTSPSFISSYEQTTMNVS
jgi:hypothetical protein